MPKAPPPTKSKEHRHVLWYVPHLLSRIAPASLFALLALPAIPWPRPARSEMLLPLFWVASMLLLLSLVPSKRADRLFPVLPAIAILAAWAIVRQVRGVSALMRVLAVVVMVAGFALIFGVGGLQLPPIPGVGIVILGAGAAMFVPRQGVQIAALVMAMIAAMSAYQFHLRPDLRAPGGIVALDSEPELQRQLDLPRRRGLLE